MISLVYTNIIKIFSHLLLPIETNKYNNHQFSAESISFFLDSE